MAMTNQQLEAIKRRVKLRELHRRMDENRDDWYKYGVRDDHHDWFAAEDMETAVADIETLLSEVDGLTALAAQDGPEVQKQSESEAGESSGSEVGLARDVERCQKKQDEGGNAED